MALVDSLKEHYSFSALKEIDWNELSGRYRNAAESARSVDAFVDVIGKMLAELADLHVWIELPDGSTVHPYVSRYRANYDHRAVRAKLDALRQFGQLGFVGRTEEGFGVVVIDGLPAEGDAVYTEFTDAVAQMFNAPGLIVDLRSNGGGSENRAAQIAGLFADKKYLYARSKVRAGPRIDDFRETPARYIEPTTARPFTRPVICLVGPGCVSSGEGFALMMKAIDHVTLVGQPTRGASGNPHPVTLANGVKVWFSRWVSLQPDGTPIEGQGVQPDIKLEQRGAGDSTFDEAVKILSQRTADQRPEADELNQTPR